MESVDLRGNFRRRYSQSNVKVFFFIFMILHHITIANSEFLKNYVYIL